MGSNEAIRAGFGSAMKRVARRMGWLDPRGDSHPDWSDRRLRGLRGEAGGAMVEFAVTMPILLSFVFGLIEVCMACYTHEMISEVSREATRYAIVHGSTCVTGSGSSCTATASSINSYASAHVWPNLGGGAIVADTTYPDGNAAPGSRVKVQVTYGFPLSIPFIPPTKLTMSSASEMYIIQ